MIIEERLPIGTIEQDVLEGKLSNQFLTANITEVSIKGNLENEQVLFGTLNEIQVLNGEINNGESGSTPVLQDKSVSYNPTKITQNITVRADNGYDGLDEVSITINSIPSQYIIPSGTKSITSNGTGIDVTNYASVDVAVPAIIPTLQNKTVSYIPTEAAQSATISADNGYDGLDEVTVNIGGISSNYVGTGIIRRDSEDLSVSGAIVSVPNGYYSSSAAASVSTITHNNPTISVNSSTGQITASHTQSSGYIIAGTTNSTYNLTTASSLTITPTEQAQTAVASGVFTIGVVSVAAISSDYVGSNVTRRSSSDLTTSGDTITAPSGYYTSSVSATVQSGTAGMPTATKGSVSNHSVSITPSVTNTTGYITGDTLTGTAVTVSASELVSGTQTITTNGTVDVTNLSEVVVDVSGGTVSGDRILNAEGTYDVSSLATATYIYPALLRAYINVSNHYWAYYNDSSTSFCFEVQPNKRYTLTWDDTVTFNLYRIGFTNSRHYPSTSGTSATYRRNIYDASGERGVEQNGFVRSVSFTPSEGLVLCVVQIEGNTNDWNNGNIFSYFIDKMKHLTITVE